MRMKVISTKKMRDPFLVHLTNRPSGPMGKSKKAIRRDAKNNLKKGDSDG